MEKLKLYLAEYCWESLKNLLLSDCELQYLCCVEQFINIETIILYHCLHHELPNGTNFPNLKSFSLLEPQFCKNSAKMAFTFPSLTHLSIMFASRYYSNEISKQQENEIIELLKLNPQIVHLELELLENYSRALFQNLTGCLSNVRHLVLRNNGSKLFQNIEYAFHSESVENFELSCTLKSEISHIPFIFTKLKSMTLRICCTDASFNFIAKHRDTKSIHLFDLISSSHPELKFELIPLNIEELTIGLFCDLPEHFIFRFLQGRRRLKYLSLNVIFPKITAIQSCQRLCDAMKLNNIQFDVKSIENIDSETIELHVRKFSNFSKMEVIIKISSYYTDQRGTQIHWYTINK